MKEKAIALLLYIKIVFSYPRGKNMINEYYAGIPYIEKK